MEAENKRNTVVEMEIVKEKVAPKQAKQEEPIANDWELI